MLITSEYRFQQRLLRYSPSLDYIDTFYLGEMTHYDAFSLYQYFKRESQGQRMPGSSTRPWGATQFTWALPQRGV